MAQPRSIVVAVVGVHCFASSGHAFRGWARLQRAAWGLARWRDAPHPTPSSIVRTHPIGKTSYRCRHACHRRCGQHQHRRRRRPPRAQGLESVVGHGLGDVPHRLVRSDWFRGMESQRCHKARCCRLVRARHGVRIGRRGSAGRWQRERSPRRMVVVELPALRGLRRARPLPACGRWALGFPRKGRHGLQQGRGRHGTARGMRLPRGPVIGLRRGLVGR